ncbi:hypothetical protein GJ744_004362 [Endocarpon pusillum]|uniref:F-box domain-containing protein n=1 Tax=Endocarpon pusillum TaxID=364733 RepID=A0A8H7ATG2_9EURO|nr:hypothetical protein GJ744_004362 [Endocarpon pusillum]
MPRSAHSIWGVPGLKEGRVQDAIYRGWVFPGLIADGPIKMIRFPDNMLNTTSVLSQPPAATGRKSRAKKKFNLAGLPNEVLLIIFDYLDVFDSATLALTCKHLAGIASTYSKLDLPKDTACKYRARKPYEAADFLKKRIGDKFFSQRLRYCWGCKIYVPRMKSHWRCKLEKKCWEGRQRGRDRVTFAEWWATPKTQQMLAKWEQGKALKKCPSCKYSRDGFWLVS